MRSVATQKWAESVSFHSTDTFNGIASGSVCSCTLKSKNASCVRRPALNAR